MRGTDIQWRLVQTCLGQTLGQFPTHCFAFLDVLVRIDVHERVAIGIQLPTFLPQIRIDNLLTCLRIIQYRNERNSNARL
jgi:hypothetical protein